MQENNEQPMKEQIEEMRKDLVEIFDEEYVKRRIITADFTAIKMDAKGYRKQSEGEWEARTDVVGFVRCSVCKDCNVYDEWVDGKKWNYCPNCGAKMKGGAE
jgi:hypothetical protein